MAKLEDMLSYAQEVVEITKGKTRQDLDNAQDNLLFLRHLLAPFRPKNCDRSEMQSLMGLAPLSWVETPTARVE